jgi:nitronate monooxygenase
MAGGPSTARLSAAVGEAGGFGFLAAGYQSPANLSAAIGELRSLTHAPFGVNLFVPGADAADPAAIDAYLGELAGEARRLGVELGRARFDDDGWQEKLALLESARPAVVSFTFGCPPAEVIARVRNAGSEAWVTVTSAAEADQAARAGADALIVQGAEAGGHRGAFTDSGAEEPVGVLALIALVRQRTALPLVACGAIMDGSAVAGVLVAGASAAALGTAFMRTPEAGTAAAQRDALAAPGRTALTRAFSGRSARGIVNRFQAEYDAIAPTAYPQIHHATSPLRAAARAAGDAGGFNLWAGQAFALGRECGAAELVAALDVELRDALGRACERYAAAP